ncbi:hypothetical protein [Nocardioides sp. BYT-33-1]|uniref:hypothetical protein n=1 Tax=Nocardioides sp. BYT-33-1 TaxID=3416952 RepID=UPI003F5306D0
MAFASSASAATPTYVDVTNNPAGTYTYDGVNKGTISASLGGLNATCTGATPVASVTDGPYTGTIMSISAFNIVGCTGIFGVGVTITNNCAGLVNGTATTSVTSAMTDVFDVELDLDPGCLHVQTAAPFSSCTLDIAGQVTGTFDENPKADNSQELSISGNTLYATNVGDCFGIVEENDTVSFSLDVNWTIRDATVGHINVT